MRRVLDLTTFVAYLALAVGAPFLAGGNWLVLALTPFMLGRAVLMIATSSSLAGIRARCRLSQADALVGYALAYTAAGVCLGIAAAIQLDGAVAVVVALGAALWVALWAWAATRMRAEANRVDL